MDYYIIYEIELLKLYNKIILQLYNNQQYECNDSITYPRYVILQSKRSSICTVSWHRERTGFRARGM